ncbi:hypothetical protein BC332_04515 [Capsicum chinense]|nr:hypothetical protein BC332_04515 [Capsicum chinense]
MHRTSALRSSAQADPAVVDQGCLQSINVEEEEKTSMFMKLSKMNEGFSSSTEGLWDLPAVYIGGKYLGDFDKVMQSHIIWFPKEQKPNQVQVKEQEKECFKRDDADANSPSTEELVKAFSIDRYPNKNEIVWSNIHYKKTILEGWLVVVDGAVGGGSSVVGANDAHLTVFKANHYEYDHTSYTDFASPSKWSAYKCQDCRAKHDVVINAINALTASIKELTS